MSVQLRFGVVTALGSGGKVTVAVAPSTVGESMPKLAAYAPSVNDKVAVLVDGAVQLVLGRVG